MNLFVYPFIKEKKYLKLKDIKFISSSKYINPYHALKFRGNNHDSSVEAPRATENQLHPTKANQLFQQIDGVFFYSIQNIGKEKRKRKTATNFTDFLEINNLVDNYMFKINNRNTKRTCEICSKLTIKTRERRSSIGTWGDQAKNH